MRTCTKTNSPTLSRGMFIVLSAPAGTGKTTLVKKLVENLPWVVASVSYTTRHPRSDEIEGVHYHFISRESFEKMIQAGDFLEFVEFCGNYYGTSRKWVEAMQQEGKHVVLTIDTEGGLSLKDKKDGIYIFVLPPSLKVQRERLESRGTESQEDIEKRLARTPKELRAAINYDYVIVNEDLEIACSALINIIIAEEHKISRLLLDASCPKLLIKEE